MKKILFNLLFAAIVFTFIKCKNNTQILEIELPEHTPKLVPYAFLTSDSTVEVVVKHSLGALEEGFQKIDSATITLYKNDEVLADNFQFITSSHYNEYGFYTTAPLSLAEAGVHYKLEVAADGFETVTAECTTVKKVPIKEVTYEVGAGIGEEGEMVDKVNLTFKDPQGEENYYIFTCELGDYSYYVDPLTGDTTYYSTYSNNLQSIDPRAETYYLSFVFGQTDLRSSITIINDKDFDGQEIKINFTNYSGLTKEDTGKIVHARLYTIPKDMYYFVQSAGQYEKAQEAIFPEPVAIYSNVKNGYGIFSIYQVDTKEIETE